MPPSKHNRTESKADAVRYAPNNPYPLSTLKTELVWKGKYNEYTNCSTKPEMLTASHRQRHQIANVGAASICSFGSWWPWCP